MNATQSPQALAVTETICLLLHEVHELAVRILSHHGMSSPHAQAIARVITAGQRDECHSHGVYRLLVCARTLRLGKVSGTTKPIVTERSPAIVAVDARFSFVVFGRTHAAAQAAVAIPKRAKPCLV